MTSMGFYMCVSILVMYKLMSGRNTNEWATFGPSQSTGQGQGRDLIISGSNWLCVCLGFSSNINEDIIE